MSTDMQTTTEAPCVTGKPLAHDQYIVEQLTKFICRRERIEMAYGSGYPSWAACEGVRSAAREFFADLDRNLAERAAGPCVWIGGTYEAPTVCEEPRADLGRSLCCVEHTAAYVAGQTSLPFSREIVLFRLAAVREHRCAADPAAGFTGPCDGPADWRTVVTAPDREPEWSPRMCRVHADQWMAECDRLPGAYPHEIVCDPYPCDHPAGTVNGVCPSCGPIDADDTANGGEHFVISPTGARHIVAPDGRCQTCGPQCAFEAIQS